jgi:hypothetical protein
MPFGKLMMSDAFLIQHFIGLDVNYLLFRRDDYLRVIDFIVDNARDGSENIITQLIQMIERRSISLPLGSIFMNIIVEPLLQLPFELHLFLGVLCVCVAKAFAIVRQTFYLSEETKDVLLCILDL